MFETISIGTSGLLSSEKGLRVVGNNLANVNTTGFKSSQVGFASMFDQQSGTGTGQGEGSGVSAGGTTINFLAGLDQSTGSPTDVKINGNGFFVVKRGNEYLYTRAGDFRFDDQGVMVNAAGDKVQSLDDGGKLVDLTIGRYSTNPPKATSTVKFSGNLAAYNGNIAPADQTLSNITVIDGSGGSHNLTLVFKATAPSEFKATITEGATTVGSSTIRFAGGAPVAGFNNLAVTYAPAGTAAINLNFDFSRDVFSQIGSSSIAFAGQDGYVAGAKSDQGIGSDGVVSVKYSNGQSTPGPRLALADFGSPQDLTEAGQSAFRRSATAVATYGRAGENGLGTLVSGHREGSNVDLAEEFSNLILMQRGYQAASHVVSTANEMIQQLFDMKGGR